MRRPERVVFRADQEDSGGQLGVPGNARQEVSAEGVAGVAGGESADTADTAARRLRRVRERMAAIFGLRRAS